MPNLAYSTPHIESVAPENGAQNVDVGTDIVVVFSGDIDVSTLNERTVTLYGGSESLGISFDYDSTARTLNIKTDELLLADEEYTLRLSSDIKNISGDSLDRDFISNFTTTDIDMLKSPEIVNPVNQSIINTPKIVWKKTELAEAYTVEIAEDPNFKRLVYSNNLINDYQIIIDSSDENVGITVDKLEYNSEYFLRIRALDVIYDTVQAETEVPKENIYYYSDNQRRVILDDSYSPIVNVNSVTVFDEVNNAYNLNPEKVEIDSTSKSLIIDAGDIKISSVLVDIDYGIKKDNSNWSDTISFYYEERDSEAEDFKDIILSSLSNNKAGDVEVVSPEKLINVKTDIGEIKFKVYGAASVADVSVEFEGFSINDIPYIESHGTVDGTLSLLEDNEDYLLVSYIVPELFENNEYLLNISFEERESNIKIISKINPALTTIKVVRNSNIGSFLESIDDEKIIYSIYDNSVLATDIAASADNEIDLSSPSFAAVKYTTLKTELDLLYAMYLEKTSTKSTKLGDFSVDAFKFEEISPILDELREQIKYWESVLKGNETSFASPLSVKKSEGTYGLGGRTF